MADLSSSEELSDTGSSTEDIYVLPTLYKSSKTGKKVEWKISVKGSTVNKSYGTANGKKINNSREYEALRKGAISAEANAKRSAEAEWVKKTSSGYAPTSKEGIKLLKKVSEVQSRQGGVNTGMAEVLSGKTKTAKTSGTIKSSGVNYKPMHCLAWDDTPKCEKYFDFNKGVYVQPKMDGVRCMGRVVGNLVQLLSRTGKEIVHLNHIRDQIKVLIGNKKEMVLDGEIYAEEIHGKFVPEGKENKKGKKKGIYIESKSILDNNEKFEVISSAARPIRTNPHPLEGELSYYIFDMIDGSEPTKPQTERFEMLEEIFASTKANKIPNIRKVKTLKITNQKKIPSIHSEMVEAGHEGLIVRAHDMVYQSGIRSSKMRKFKSFLDIEVQIEGVEKDSGVGDEHFTWVCVLLDNPQIGNFKAKMRGTVERKRDYYANYEDYIGKLLTVKLQGYTSLGKPRFPVGIGIRDPDQ